MAFELGLKGNISDKQIKDRLRFSVLTYEFHLVWEDLKNLNELKRKIQMVFDARVENIILHHPMKGSKGNYNESYFDETNKSEYSDWLKSTRILGDLSKEFQKLGYNLRALVHLTYGSTLTYLDYKYTSIEAQRNLFTNLLLINKEYESLVFFENGITHLDGLALSNELIQNFLLENRIPLCIDVSHLFISLKGNQSEMKLIMSKLSKIIVHYHIVDSLGVIHDSLSIGEGLIDWYSLIPYFNNEATSIYEINLSDQNHCVEMIESYKTFKVIREKREVDELKLLKEIEEGYKSLNTESTYSDKEFIEKLEDDNEFT